MSAKHLLFALAGMLLIGCGGRGGSFEIWMVYFTGGDNGTQSQELTHNFQGGSIADPGTTPGPWTYDYTAQQSDGMFFVQVVNTNTGKILTMRDPATDTVNTLVGTQEGEEWLFSWANNEITTETNSHDTGYTYVEERDVTLLRDVRINFNGAETTGTASYTYTEMRSYTESDVWDNNATGIWVGDIPSNSYLWDNSQNMISNDSTTSECTDTNCTLSITNTYEIDVPLTAELTDLVQEDAFLVMGNAGQESGVPNM